MENLLIQPALSLFLTFQSLSFQTLRCYHESDNTLIECSLQDTILSNETLSTQIFFNLNDTMNLLGMEELEIVFTVRDGGTGTISSEHVQAVALDSVGEYRLAGM